MFVAALGGVCLQVWSTIALAGAMVTLSGILGDKALLSISGSPPKVMRIGDMHQSIKLVSVQDNQVVIEEDGRRRTISLGFANSVANAGTDGHKTVLNADGRGLFHAAGQVNNADVRFIVDTGASLVALPKSVAHRAGVSLDNVPQGRVSTAGGVVSAWRVKLNRVRVGNITLHMVDAAVLDDAHLPLALLGMSFLNRTNMNREGELMTLTQRY